MGEIRINTGGGGLVIGAGGVASGAGGDIVYNSPGARVSSARVLDGRDLSVFIGALGEVRAALIASGVDRATAWAGELSALEQRVLADNGVLDAAVARTLLGRIRHAACVNKGVSDAIGRAAGPLRRDTQPFDVFVSYKREERAQVERIVDALQALGVRVWFDAQLTPGRSFTDQICDEIDGCAAQLVCWSVAAAASDWVRGEAEIGRRRAALVPVLIQPCNLPPPFNMLHAEDLSEWRGEAEHSAWRKVLDALAVKLARPDLAASARDLHG